MANLKNNGTELARLRRVAPSEGLEPPFEQILSVRSNGWILKRTTSTGWKQWQQWKPAGRQTSTLPQQVRHLQDNCGYVLEAGSIEAVAAGWTALCEKAFGRRRVA